MELQKQCVSLDLAKKMKELEFEQDSLFYWAKEINVIGWRFVFNFEFDGYKLGILMGATKSIAAYTVAELGEMLPMESGGKVLKITKDNDGNWYCFYERNSIGAIVDSKIIYDQLDKNLADCLAKMLIYLKEQKLI